MSETPELSEAEAVQVAAFGLDKPEPTQADYDWDTAELIAEARKTQGHSEGDLRSLVRSLTDALEASRPLVVTTVEELDALPEYTVILDKYQDSWQYRCGLWNSYETRPFGSERVFRKYSPITILWTPTEATR